MNYTTAGGSDAQRESAQRANIAQANADALLKLCAEYSITLRTAEAHLWRPCVRTRGDIPGVAEGLTLLCTDGVCAWFVNDIGTLLFGHVQRFDGEVQTLHGMSKSKVKPGDGTVPTGGTRRKTRTPKTSATAVAVELLQQMLSNLKTQ
jgi:hypothetical protein